jgi:hypothetical protein
MASLVALGMVLGACRPSGSSGARKKGADGRIMEVEKTSEDDPFKTDWQLLDHSLFTATFEPSPPKAGVVQLKAEATRDDEDQKFLGTVDYRLAGSEENSEPWKPMPQVGEDEIGTVQFAIPVTLTNGTTYIQFRVRDYGDEDYTQLTDWKVEVP